MQDPINFVDPDGQIPLILVPGAIGMVIGGTAGAIAAYHSGGNVLSGMAIGAVSGAISAYTGPLGGAAVAAGANAAGQLASGTSAKCLDYKSIGISAVVGGAAGWLGGAAAGRFQIPFNPIGRPPGFPGNQLSNSIIGPGVSGTAGGLGSFWGN